MGCVKFNYFNTPDLENLYKIQQVKIKTNEEWMTLQVLNTGYLPTFKALNKLHTPHTLFYQYIGLDPIKCPDRDQNE